MLQSNSEPIVKLISAVPIRNDCLLVVIVEISGTQETVRWPVEWLYCVQLVTVIIVRNDYTVSSYHNNINNVIFYRETRIWMVC